VVSIIHLRKYRGQGHDIRPLPIIVGENEEFEVERIDGERVNARGVREYLVKWLGYAEKERTWEPMDHLEHADTMIADWHARNADAPESSSRRRRIPTHSPSRTHARTPAHTPPRPTNASNDNATAGARRSHRTRTATQVRAEHHSNVVADSKAHHDVEPGKVEPQRRNVVVANHSSVLRKVEPQCRNVVVANDSTIVGHRSNGVAERYPNVSEVNCGTRSVTG
jgi:hypothetical protein